MKVGEGSNINLDELGAFVKQAVESYTHPRELHAKMNPAPNAR
jgi:hypothetical protein